MKQRREYNKGYLFTPTGLLNLAEIICLIIALICVGFTSRLFAELADNLRWTYPDLSTLTVRGLFQSFALLALITTVLILLAHWISYRSFRKYFLRLNQISLVTNVLLGLLIISISICAALWEDKLRRTPPIVKRGYFSNQYQVIFHEETHPRPGAAAAAAAFGLLAGILFLVEACTRPMLGTMIKGLPLDTTRPSYTVVPPNSADRIIPIENASRV